MCCWFDPFSDRPRNPSGRAGLAAVPELPQNLADGIFESGLVGGGEGAELADDEGLFQRGEDRLDGGGFEQPGRLPVPQPDFAECWAGAELAGDRHQHDIRLGAVVGERADGPK